MCGSNDPFIGVAYQISCISDIYIMVHSNSKISYEVATKIILWLELLQYEELFLRDAAFGRLRTTRIEGCGRRFPVCQLQLTPHSSYSESHVNTLRISGWVRYFYTRMCTSQNFTFTMINKLGQTIKSLVTLESLET